MSSHRWTHFNLSENRWWWLFERNSIGFECLLSTTEILSVPSHLNFHLNVYENTANKTFQWIEVWWAFRMVNWVNFTKWKSSKLIHLSCAFVVFVKVLKFIVSFWIWVKFVIGIGIVDGVTIATETWNY